MSIQHTSYAYTAMWARLLAIHHHNLRGRDRRIKRVACPGLGTLTRRMCAEESARKMALAYQWFLQLEADISWPYSLARQSAIAAEGGF